METSPNACLLFSSNLLFNHFHISCIYELNPSPFSGGSLGETTDNKTLIRHGRRGCRVSRLERMAAWQQGSRATREHSSKAAREQCSMSAMQQGSIAAGTSAVSFWPLFAAPGVPQDISSRSFVYYCDRRCTMPPVCRSAPSRCNVLPTALLLCCAISAYCFTTSKCDVPRTANIGVNIPLAAQIADLRAVFVL